MNTPYLENNHLQSVITLQKLSLESSLNFMSAMQKVAESSIQQAIAQAPWIPKEGKLMMEQWLGAMNSGRTSFEKVLRDGFNQLTDSLEPKTDK